MRAREIYFVRRGAHDNGVQELENCLIVRRGAHDDGAESTTQMVRDLLRD